MWDTFETTGSNLAKLRNDIHSLTEQYHNIITTRCYQLKIHRTMDDDYEQVVRDFHEEENVKPGLNKIKLIEDQWRTLDLWEILQYMNPGPPTKFSRDELFEQDSTSIEKKEDMNFRWSIVLCGFFDNLMRELGWKVGDPIEIEEDMCDVVGQLLMKVETQDRSSLLDCMQTAIMYIQATGSKQYGDKLRSLLITKKNYNGLNLACILLEQMILDNKDIQRILDENSLRSIH